MNEILILYTLNKSQTTMYGLSKYINNNFGAITKPSFGTLQPLLKKLEKAQLIFSSKFYTDGGKPYFYYSLTEKGINALKERLLKLSSINPVQLIPSSKIRIACSDVLENSERLSLLKTIKLKVQKLKADAESALDAQESNFYQRIILDNTVCEYKNLISLIEGLEKCPQ